MQWREAIYPFLNSNLGLFVRNPISSHFRLNRSFGSFYFSSPNISKNSSARYFFIDFNIYSLPHVQCLVPNIVSHISLENASISASIFRQSICTQLYYLIIVKFKLFSKAKTFKELFLIASWFCIKLRNNLFHLVT
jgi:hypothetical protein